jgi:molybdate transport system substrate-binding protein
MTTRQGWGSAVAGWVLLLAAGCAATRPAAEIRVAAAADLQFAMPEILGEFGRAHPAVPVSVTYGSSGNFYSQIANGAPFDVYFSADMSYPQRLADQGLALEGSLFRYAVGRLALWVPAGSPLEIEKRGLGALQSPEARHVAIANPRHAPYGQAAEAALRWLGIYEAVQTKLVYGENVSQALQFVQTGAAEAGIVALSLAVAPAVTGTGRHVEIPLETFPRLEQGGIILRSAANPEAAQLLRSFVLGEAGRAILKRFGFFLPEG